MKGELELLPCPWCGGEPTVIENDSYNGCGISCSICDVMPDQACGIVGTLDQCIIGWNARGAIPKTVLAPVSERARSFAEDAIRFAWATPHFGLGEVSAGYRDADPVVQPFARFERDLAPDNGLREALERSPDHPFEDLSDALAACERIRDESTHAQSLPEGYLLGFRAGSNGCVVALLNLIGFRTQAGERDGEASFQSRVAPWMQECFGPVISGDRIERGDRFLEESLELLQSGGYDRDRVTLLVDYVWNRPVGEPSQEVGGVGVTLAAYCLAFGLDMHEAFETELARILQPEIVEKIRIKQATKAAAIGNSSPLPIAPSLSQAPR
jgi:hypothetical protein